MVNTFLMQQYMSLIFVKGKELLKEHKDLKKFIETNINAHILKTNLVKTID